MTLDAPRRSDLSQDQLVVYDAILDWIAAGTPTPYLTLGGLAGCGKTTLVTALACDFQNRRIVFTAFTGKAVDVLRRKLASYGLQNECHTLHSLMYTPQEDEATGYIRGWHKQDSLGPIDLIVVDEASMLQKDLWEDLLSYRIPILAVGDHGQLPPVGERTMSLLISPHLRLEKIHRQAEGSPIIRLAHHVRNGGALSDVPWGPGLFAPRELDPALIMPWDSAGIAFTNEQRCRMNRKVVDAITDRPNGHTVICLKNYQLLGLFNGMRGRMLDIASTSDPQGRREAEIEFPDHDGLSISEKIQVAQFFNERTFQAWSELRELGLEIRHKWDMGLLFDFGYALTCHKSQGSQYRVVFLDPRTPHFLTNEERIRWTYTAATRAIEELHVLSA